MICLICWQNLRFSSQFRLEEDAIQVPQERTCLLRNSNACCFFPSLIENSTLMVNHISFLSIWLLFSPVHYRDMCYWHSDMKKNHFVSLHIQNVSVEEPLMPAAFITCQARILHDALEFAKYLPRSCFNSLFFYFLVIRELGKVRRTVWINYR